MLDAIRSKLGRIVLSGAICGCLFQPAIAHAASDGRSGVERVFAVALDVVVVRPLATIATVVGSVLFVPAALVTSPGGRHSIEQAWDKFVVVPSENAFTRPLGDF